MAAVIVCCEETRRRNKLTSLLQSMGLTIIAEPADAPQALRLARSLRPDLVVMDIEQYEHNELDTARTIAKEKLAPVILIALPGREQIYRAIEEEYAMSYVGKPFNQWALESAVRTALANFRKIAQMENEINKLKETLETRKLVERAKYVLMRDLSISEPEALRRLQKQSMDKGIAMKELAEAILLNEDLKKK